ncbi:MAG: CotH kinase family protein [Prevotella sp.]|nr:CotH kinase family protein [Prevotella sp.]
MKRIVWLLLSLLLLSSESEARCLHLASNDTTFVYLRNGDVDVYPQDLARIENAENDGWNAIWNDGTIVYYDAQEVERISSEPPSSLPEFTMFKLNNKYNHQVYTDVEADISDRLIALKVGCIGKWLTPSFQLSDEQAVAYIGNEQQYSKRSRRRFDTDVIYTVASPGMRILRRHPKPQGSDETVYPLMLTLDQLSTNAPSNYDEGLDKAIDNNPSTFFHSTWGEGIYQKLPEDSCPHIEIHLDEPLRSVQWSIITRSDANRMPRVIELMASDDGDSWRHVASYTTADGLPTQPGASFTSPTADLGRACSYLRIIQREASYKNYFCVAELDLAKVQPKDEGQQGDYVYAMEPYGHDYTVQVEWLSDGSTNVPTVSINTQNGQMISSKENYLEAEITIDGAGVFPSMSATPVLIKGRGNTSWSTNPWDKNPYRLKFNEKVKPFGLTKGKSWVLLANKLSGSMMTNAIGMKVANLAGTAFSNHIVPVELYINGQYRGSYNFTEKIGFSNNSIDLEDESDATLLELDTYYDEPYKFKSNPYNLPVQIKEPDFSEGTTTLTMNDITTDFNKVMRQLKAGAEIAELVDIDQLARYLMVCDLIENYELMHPKSTFLYKEHVKGDSKYIFGPVWDLDWAFGYELHYNYCISEQEADYFDRVWMESRQFVRDLRYVSKQLDRAYYKVWTQFIRNGLDELLDYCGDYFKYARPSFENNQKKWNDGNNYASAAVNARNWLKQRAEYVYAHLTPYELTDEELNPYTGIESLLVDSTTYDRHSHGFVDVFNLQGMCVKRQVPLAQLRSHLPSGIYIVNGKKLILK